MRSRKSLHLLFVVMLIVGLLPLTAAAQPPANTEAEGTANSYLDSLVEGAPETLTGLFPPGQPYNPAVAQAAIASAERSPAAQGEDELCWTQRSPANIPLARLPLGGLAYDSARGVTVLFGGNGGTSGMLNDTWEWDGTDWTRRVPANNPTPRESGHLAYDSARGVTVLFGGYDGSSRFNDTWEWDGTNWTLRSPAHKPSKRSGHDLAYDSARGVTVLFGGYTSGVGHLNDTWEWDGTDWTLRSPVHKPTGRWNTALAYDSARGVAVLFGGNDGYNNRLDDTWEWDGTDWTQRFPANKPPPRERNALAYDSGRGVTVLFGGDDGYYLFGDTWEWDGADWTQRFPLTQPTARTGPGLAYDSARGVTILFGGAPDFIGGRLDDTWEYPLFCAANCWTHLFRTRLNWAYAARPGWVKTVFLGKVHDQDRNLLQGATVHGHWILNGVAQPAQTAVTDALGSFKFRWKGPWAAPGTYAFHVTYIAYDNCLYDPGANHDPDYREVTIPWPPE